MIHGQRDIVTRPRAGVKHRVGGQRAESIDPFGAQGLDRRRDDRDLLAPHRAALAGVRVEASDSEARAGHAKTTLQIAVDHPRGLNKEVDCQRLRRLGKRDVDRDWHDRERLRPDHHHRECRSAPGAGQFTEIFCVPGKPETSFVKRRLGDRVGDDSARQARAAPPKPRARSIPGSLRRWRRSDVRAPPPPNCRAGRRASPSFDDGCGKLGVRLDDRCWRTDPPSDVLKERERDARTKKGGSPGARRRQAASANSGPIPAGSPIVIARGGRSNFMIIAPAQRIAAATGRRSP